MTPVESMAATVGFYDGQRAHVEEYEARQKAVAYLLSKIPTLDDLDGAVMLADTLARRAEQRS